MSVPETSYTGYTNALVYAARAHDGQYRKYSGAPYITHPIRVAGLVHKLFDSDRYKILAQQVALLHDVIEDTTITYDQISDYFNPEVAQGVWGLTDCVARGIATPVVDNRAKRKAMDVEWLRIQAPLVRAIKLLDIADNLTEMDEHDPFMGVFLGELVDLAPVLLKDLENYPLTRVGVHYCTVKDKALNTWRLAKE